MTPTQKLSDTFAPAQIRGLTRNNELLKTAPTAEAVRQFDQLLESGQREQAEALALKHGYSVKDVGDYALKRYDDWLNTIPMREAEGVSFRAPTPEYDEFGNALHGMGALVRGYTGTAQGDESSPDPREAIKNRASLYATQQYEDAIMAANKEAGWGEKQRKYASRHAEYLNHLSSAIGQPITSVATSKALPSNVYVVTAADGTQYYLDAPTSPGGSYFDVDLGQGAKGLGLGFLGGTGKYKNLPAGAGASYIPVSAHSGGVPSLTKATDINVPKGPGPLAAIAALASTFVLGPGGLALMSAPMAGAVGGALSAGMTGGNVLKGAALGGLGGLASGALSGGEMASSIGTGGDLGFGNMLTDSAVTSGAATSGGFSITGNPIADKAIVGAGKNIISSGISGRPITPQGLATSALAGGVGAGVSEAVGDATGNRFLGNLSGQLAGAGVRGLTAGQPQVTAPGTNAPTLRPTTTIKPTVPPTGGLARYLPRKPTWLGPRETSVRGLA